MNTLVHAKGKYWSLMTYECSVHKAKHYFSISNQIVLNLIPELSCEWLVNWNLLQQIYFPKTGSFRRKLYRSGVREWKFSGCKEFLCSSHGSTEYKFHYCASDSQVLIHKLQSGMGAKCKTVAPKCDEYLLQIMHFTSFIYLAQRILMYF